MWSGFPPFAISCPIRSWTCAWIRRATPWPETRSFSRSCWNCRGAVDIRQDYSQLADVVKEGLRRFCDRYAKSLARAGNPAVQEARRFMWEHYARRLTLGEIAAHVHLNPQYFSVLFKRETGQSVVDHLTHLRLEQAKCLLKDTSLPINQVAGQVGYEDPDYFSRLFHKVNGMSPRQYRGIVGSG